ncbi:MAG: flagellar hook protein FlgE, partial [Gammaproteobacteria bacterium]|nr:flagellar hook protein FlgE [Gammaproteobacteria bacterium]
AKSNLGTTSNAIGQGVQVAAVEQQFTQGNISFTNNNLDLAINGNGFFAVDEPSGARAYTRSGVFGVDKDGFVVNPTGHKLQGFQASNGAITGAVGSIQLSTANIPPQVTSSMVVGVNLDAASTAPSVAFDPAVPNSYNNVTSTTVFDSLGEEHLAAIYFRKTAANTWESHVRIDGDNAQTTAVVGLGFDNAGQLTTPMPVNYGAFTPTTGAAAFSINFDFSGSTQFGSQFGVNALSQNGYTTGRLNGVDIDENGVVQARFTNGESLAQAQVVLANFANAQGLQPISDSTWAETNSSGAALVGAPGSASLGLIQAGALEESNVDLAEQLVKMIIAQRNYQANAQMIQTEDEITQTIINIR